MGDDYVFEDEDVFDEFYQEAQDTVEAGGSLAATDADRLLYNAVEHDVEDAYRTVVESYANADDLDGNGLMRLWNVQVHCREEGIDIGREMGQVQAIHLDGVGDAVRLLGKNVAGLLTYRGWTSPHFDISDEALN